MAKFIEREITAPVNLCDGAGSLNPTAKGWSRTPQHICNLSGHFPKKKKWNFWLILNEEFAFSATIANVDYLGLVSAFVMDFKRGELYEDASIIPRGIGVNMPDTVDADVSVKNKKITASFIHTRTQSPSARRATISTEGSLSLMSRCKNRRGTRRSML